MQNKKISIIVPLYNAEKYIEQTIEDLIAQTYQNIEIIMINDGSVDKSEDIVRKYAREDDRIKRIRVRPKQEMSDLIWQQGIISGS